MEKFGKLWDGLGEIYLLNFTKYDKLIQLINKLPKEFCQVFLKISKILFNLSKKFFYIEQNLTDFPENLKNFQKVSKFLQFQKFSQIKQILSFLKEEISQSRF